MLACRRRSQRCHRKINAVAGQRYRVHVAFNYDQPLDVAQSLACLIKTVQFAAFMKQDCFWRIQIFWLVIAHDSTTETNGSATSITDREHDSVAEAIVVLAIVLTNYQAGGQQFFDRLIRFSKLIKHIAPAFRGVADTEALRRWSINATILHVFDRSRCVFEA